MRRGARHVASMVEARRTSTSGRAPRRTRPSRTPASGRHVLKDVGGEDDGAVRHGGHHLSHTRHPRRLAAPQSRRLAAGWPALPACCHCAAAPHPYRCRWLARIVRGRARRTLAVEPVDECKQLPPPALIRPSPIKWWPQSRSSQPLRMHTSRRKYCEHGIIKAAKRVVGLDHRNHKIP